MLSKLLQIIFILLFFISAGHGKNICSTTNCKNNKQLCKLQQSPNPARHCLNLDILVRTENDKKLLLDKINSRRNKVASGGIKSFPSAESMMMLEWNSKLEFSAQRWANQCVMSSTPDIKDACRDLGDTSVGQNIATIYGESPGLLPTALVDIWYMELLNVNSSILPRYRESAENGPHHDYFTQLVWANTTDVGCGGVKFREKLQDNNGGGKNRTVYRLVCNFSPSGNREGQTVYTPGAPCSRCPKETACDSGYSALCRKLRTIDAQKEISTSTKANHSSKTSVQNNTISDITSGSVQNKSTVETDEDYIPFEFFSHMHDFTTQSITIMTPTKQECNESLGVDAFIDILRKKLSTDNMFKEMLLNIKTTQGILDSTFSDPSVAAFANKIYSKIEPSTTAKSTESELLNSTLLVDLVEAVIFRSGGKAAVTDTSELSTPIISDVSPIKVQAELAEIQQNTDFTGHYFFPEEYEEEISTTESTESYYDTNLSIADVIMEIEDIKRNRVTKNFLDEILEMDTSTEPTKTTVIVLSPDDLTPYKSGHEVMKKFLEDIRNKPSGS